MNEKRFYRPSQFDETSVTCFHVYDVKMFGFFKVVKCERTAEDELQVRGQRSEAV